MSQSIYPLSPDHRENEEMDEVHIFDCGGHNEYTLINTMALTPKSLIVVIFRASKYLNHTDSYYQSVGCYLDIILSKTTDAVILLVAGFYDELEEDDFLMKNDQRQRYY